MFNYDKNLGTSPKMFDKVQICHTADPVLDSLTGTIEGWGDYAKVSAIVRLSDLYNGVRSIVIPVVCLRPL